MHETAAPLNSFPPPGGLDQEKHACLVAAISVRLPWQGDNPEAGAETASTTRPSGRGLLEGG
jgi:hypothetical protein